MPRPTPHPALAASIRRLREERGITREALAYRAGLSTGALARIELAQSSPNWDTVRRIAAALDLSISRLACPVETIELEIAKCVPVASRRHALRADLSSDRHGMPLSLKAPRWAPLN